MKIEVASCTVKSIHGATSLTVDGTPYEANKDGEIEIAQTHLTQAMSHGFALVDGAPHDGKVEIVATGHDPDKSPAQNETAQSGDVLRQDGPTVEQFVEAGYRATGYPPNGYASKSTDEEIAAAIKAQEGESINYNKLNKVELLELAETRGVKVETDANKAAILKALETYDHLEAGEYGDVLKEDLIEYAAKRKVEVDAKANKDDIIAALVKADGE